MNGDVSVNIDPALFEYVEDRVKGWFGHDKDTTLWNSRLSRRMKVALELASSVQCVGMDRPVPIGAIYQPIGLQAASGSRRGMSPTTDVHRLMNTVYKDSEEVGTDAVIYAGPGRGKSTLLNRLYTDLQTSETLSPFLFILRTDDAVPDLQEFVSRLSAGSARPVRKGQRPILLVDGYDEIGEPERHRVSQALLEFKARKLGRFYLTCRTFYDVYDLKVPLYYLSPFEEQDVMHFVNAFAKCYDVAIDADGLIRQLRDRDLWEFARHPLMLTLICILKTGPLPELPHRSLDLLTRAFDTLTLRWDQQRGIHRHSAIPIDGYDRIAILKRVAFRMRSLVESQESMEVYVRQYLSLIQRRHIDGRSVLQEIAQWYGVLVPAGDGRWQFLHRSIHDYLAARFWVESGKFNPQTVKEWDYEAAYAACLTGDATDSMVRALRNAENIQTFTECLYNGAPFHTEKVAEAVLEHFQKFRPFTHRWSGTWLTVESTQDFFSLCTEQFLRDLLRVSLLPVRAPGARSIEPRRFTPHDTLVAYTLGEFQHRKLKVAEAQVLRQLLSVFEIGEFRFQLGIERPVLFRLADVIT